MRRTYDRERYLGLVETLRAAVPDLALGTDIIVGFPGETDADFAETLEVVEEVRYESAFTFIYSPRAGTEAAALPDQVPDDVKHERLERLVDVVQRIASERNAERIGRVEEVLVEGAEPHRRRAAPRPHAAEHDSQLQRRRRSRASSSTCSSRARPRRPARPRGGARRRLTRGDISHFRHVP